MVRYHLAALNGLQKGVVNLARDPRALGKSIVEARGHAARNLAHAQAVDAADQQQRHREQRGGEPTGLPDVRLLGDLEDHALAIPEPMTIGGANPQGPRADRNVAVNRARIRRRVEPFRIDAVQPVLHMNLLGRGHFDGCEADLEMTGARRQDDRRSGRSRVAANRDALQINRRPAVANRQEAQIDQREALGRGRPERVAIPGQRQAAITNTDAGHRQPVRRRKFLDVQGLVSRQRPRQCSRLHPQQRVAAKPQGAVITVQPVPSPNAFAQLYRRGRDANAMSSPDTDPGG